MRVVLVIPLYSSYETLCKVPSMVSRTKWGPVHIRLTIYIVTIYCWLPTDIQAHSKNNNKKRYTHIHTHTHTHTHTHLSASQGSLESTFLRFLASDLDSISENHLHKIRKIEEKESPYFHLPVAGRWKGQNQKWNSQNFLGLLPIITLPRLVSLWDSCVNSWNSYISWFPHSQLF